MSGSSHGSERKSLLDATSSKSAGKQTAKDSGGKSKGHGHGVGDKDSAWRKWTILAVLCVMAVIAVFMYLPSREDTILQEEQAAMNAPPEVITQDNPATPGKKRPDSERSPEMGNSNEPAAPPPVPQ